MNAKDNSSIGTILMFPGEMIPHGWKKCDGATVKKVDLGSTFSALATALGVPNNADQLTLPNLAARFPVGAGKDASLRAAGGPDIHTHGIPGQSITLYTTYAGEHTHGIPSSLHVLDQGGPNHPCVAVANNDFTTEGGGNHNHEVTVSFKHQVTEGSPHVNLPKYMVLNFIIRVK